MKTDNRTQVQPAVQEKNITDHVLNQVNNMLNHGALFLPPNYSPENALKAAFFALQEVENKDKKKIMQDGKLDETLATKASVASALLKMVVKGLDPNKTQCYFILYGKSLELSVSYFGEVAVARRAGLEDYAPQVVYDGDDFKYEIDQNTGRKRIIHHHQNFENIDITKIKGAYVVFTANGKKDLEIMSMAQIRKAWDQGYGEQKPHKNFTDQMAMKTVISRMCKYITNTSDDAHLALDEHEDRASVIDQLHEEIRENAPIPVKTIDAMKNEAFIPPPAHEEVEYEEQEIPKAKQSPGNQLKADF